MDAAAAEEFYLRTLAGPAVDVNGIVGGEPTLQKTVLPVAAEANVSIRLAPGQDVDEIAAAFERLLREAAPDGADLEIERWSSAPAGLIPADAPAVKLAQDAFERHLDAARSSCAPGARCRSSRRWRTRGSPRSSPASPSRVQTCTRPNERLLARYIPLGVAAARETLLAFEEL